MKKIISFLGFLILIVNICFAQTQIIGTQTWCTKNLDVTTFRNGDSIPQVKSDEEWILAGENHQPAWCYYNNDSTNNSKFGKLYNWFAVNDSRGLAPKGYHIPTDAEWITLEGYLGSESGIKMKSTSEWNDNGNGTNESGFLAFPGGCRSEIGIFSFLGKYAYWWSSTESKANDVYFRNIFSFSPGLFRFFNGNKVKGFSVRCIRD
jgi:uncharacterized protein (TIGR02145 family)